MRGMLNGPLARYYNAICRQTAPYQGNFSHAVIVKFPLRRCPGDDIGVTFWFSSAAWQNTDGTAPMTSTEVLAQMRTQWDELETLLRKAQRRGVRGMTPDELSRLDELYRLSTVHLAQLRARGVNPALADEVNNLVGRAHSLVYAPPPPRPLAAVLRFYGIGFARAIARTGTFQLAALALFLAGTLGGYFASLAHPSVAYALVMPGEQLRTPGASAEQLTYVMRAGRDEGSGEKLVFAAFLLQNNTQVGFRAFAGGILAGIPTIFLMVYTGGFLGAYTAVHANQAVLTEWMAWILPHGITELGAAVLCGGAGLKIGYAILRPGAYTRRRSLYLAAREGLNIALGVIPMFIAAGFIESFVRQSQWSISERFLFAAVTALFWTLYIANGYRAERHARAQAMAQ